MKSLVAVERADYTTSSLHAYLDEHAVRPEGPNIGLRGEHLTITFLSCDRLDLSLRLLRSIQDHMPDFAGEVLIFDNGSSRSTVDGLQDFINCTALKARLVRSEANLGVARGRNYAIADVNSAWVMSLDNDVFFIKDPRQTVQRELAQLGCKFLSLPILNPDMKTHFAFGGHIHMGLDERSLLAVSGGGAFDVDEPIRDASPTVGTFLFGTACILEAATFRLCGGFDEELFVGFEDTDLSIRLFRKGLKIGCSSGSFLVHDHPQPTATDAAYERTRFSLEHIKASARYLEKKYGYSFWNAGLLEWLDLKRPDVGPGPGKFVPQSRRRVALIIDVENWAFDNIAKQLRRHLEPFFQFETFAANDLSPGALASILDGFDLLHFLSRGPLAALLAAANAGETYAGWPLRELVASLEKRSTITAAVYDHLYLSIKDLERYDADPYWYGIHMQRFKTMFNKVDGYYVSSKRLFDIYKDIPGYPAPRCSLPDGVDLSLFKPDKRAGQNGPLRVGWAGNSIWMHHQGERDPKGLRTILRPAVSALIGEGLAIELALADRHTRLIPHTQMPSFYNSLDLFVCCSESEGTPNPVLEAMACGVPVISTDVGIVPEAFGPMQRQFILSERSVDAFVNALRTLAADPMQRELLCQENLLSIQSWGWSKRARDIGSFFNEAILKKEQQSQRPACLEQVR